ncbi:mechanosensitive ion channel protein 10-like [Arachis ipaensis]|uniref:mechanosensitive ion channel protein 10-like n=1 Tax=Arachis ipaensis TaxID=130454 RepID=UPI000A2B275A|nr:mechanosensitive ion channel protein 10-like [Arachis ipaensis]
MDEKAKSSDHVAVTIDQHNNHPKTPSSSSVDNKPPKQQPLRVKTLNRLSFSKPKSRILEYNNYYPHHHLGRKLSSISQENNNDNNNEDVDEDEEEEEEWWDEEEEIEEEGEGERNKLQERRRRKKVRWRVVVEWVVFLSIATCLVCSLAITRIKKMHMVGLEIWKWCLMVMVTFSGRLVSGWVVGVTVFVIERNFMLREKVLYFIYGLRKSIRNCMWLGLVLLSYWSVVFDDVQKKNHMFLNKVFQGLVAVLVGAIIWLVKIVLVKMLASSFHVATYFDRMKESVFHHYILDTLSGPPMEDAEEILQQHRLLTGGGSKSMPARTEGAEHGEHCIRLVDDFTTAESEINSEWEARNCAQRIFNNVAKPAAKYIEEEDLMRFLKRVEIHTIFPLFEGALETGKISRSSFRNWVIRAYYERKALAQSLNDTKTAVQQLHKLASAIVSVIIIIVILLVMGVATLKIIFFCMTQIVLIGVAFQGTCKTVLEAIIFVFVMHPFDIGDRCVIDGVHMIVEEMNILSTVFLRYDNEKIYYPNAVLLNKPISNFYRSPEMWDSIDFTIDASTPMETIIALKKSIQIYIESKPKYWNPKHSVIAKEIQNVDKLKLCLCVQHTINHQNYGERSIRITELLLELKKIFEIHAVKYNLLPQEIHITQMNMENNGRLVFQS